MPASELPEAPSIVTPATPSIVPTISAKIVLWKSAVTQPQTPKASPTHSTTGSPSIPGAPALTTLAQCSINLRRQHVPLTEDM